MPITPARFDDLFAASQNAAHPEHATVIAAEARVFKPIFDCQDMTGDTPRVLRFERPANDIEEAVQLVAARYVMKFSRRPVLIEYTTPPTPRRLPSRQERIASVSLGHAWRVAKRSLT